jgi:8-oxo-dGTP pyrophosphatase MutT (NUDIX family)
MKPKIPDTAKKVFEGITFSIWQWEQEQFDGSYKTFEMASKRDSATMVVLVGNKVLLSEEEQPGRPSFISLPAGELDLGEEDILLAAKRELAKETGYTGGEWEHWYCSGLGSRISYANHFYIVRNPQKTQEQHLDPGGEKITVRMESFDGLIALKDEPRFRNKDFVHILEKASFDPEYKEQIRKKLWGDV